MLVRILGPLEVVSGQGELVALGGLRQRLVLGALVIEPNRVVPRDRLVDVVWGGAPPPSALASLQAYVSRLRGLLGAERIVSRAGGYVLRLGPDELDAEVADRLVGDGRRALASGMFGEAARRLSQALELWRGPVLSEFDGMGFVAAEVARLEELRLGALEGRFDAELSLGRGAELVGELDKAVARFPLRERLRGQLMVALYRSGRQAEALDSYQRVQQMLDEQLGISPSPELQQIHQQVLVQDPDISLPSTVRLVPPLAPELEGEIPPVEIPGEMAVVLPPRLTPLVGRDREVSVLAGLLAQQRLVTVTGPGGVGKTRLTVETAAAVADRHPGGVWFVDLSPLSDDGQVVGAVASAIGLKQPDPATLIDEVAAFLEGLHGLVILDNCEHLIEPAAELVHRLLGACVDLTVAATSREPLALPEEHVLWLQGLATPDPGLSPDRLATVDAVQLLVDRTRAGRPQFTVDHTNAAAVARICQALDGLPLGLELAAARLQTLAVEEVADQLGDQLASWSTARRGVPDRHRTLVATIDWSYQLLDPTEQDLLRCLSVFRGGFDLDAAHATWPTGEAFDPLELLQQLAAKSLVLADLDRDRTRYRLLEAVRAFALAELTAQGEQVEHDVCDRHADHYLSLAEAAEPHLIGPDQQQWFDRLDQERANLRAAWDWLTTRQQWHRALRLAARLSWYQLTRGQLAEGRRWLEVALAHQPDASPSLLADALNHAGILCGQQGDNPAARHHFEQALEIRRSLEDQTGAAGVLSNLAIVAYHTSDLVGARALLEEALAVPRGVDQPTDLDRHHIGGCLHSLAIVELFFGNTERAEQLANEALTYEPDFLVRTQCLDVLARSVASRGELTQARSLIDQALEIATQVGGRLEVAELLLTRGEILHAQQERPLAMEILNQSIAGLREAGDKNTLAWSLQAASRTAAQLGAHDQAAGMVTEALTLATSQGDRLAEASCLETAALLTVDGHPQAAAILLGAAHNIRNALDVPVPALYQDDVNRVREQARNTLGHQQFQDALARGNNPDALTRAITLLHSP